MISQSYLGEDNKHIRIKKIFVSVEAFLKNFVSIED